MPVSFGRANVRKTSSHILWLLHFTCQMKQQCRLKPFQIKEDFEFNLAFRKHKEVVGRVPQGQSGVGRQRDSVVTHCGKSLCSLSLNFYISDLKNLS